MELSQVMAAVLMVERLWPMLLSAVLALMQSQVLVGPRSVKLEATLVRALGRVVAEPRSVTLKTALVRALERALWLVGLLKATLVRVLGRVVLELRSVKLAAVSRVLGRVGRPA